LFLPITVETLVLVLEEEEDDDDEEEEDGAVGPPWWNVPGTDSRADPVNP
jgi:hypothetical protein